LEDTWVCARRSIEEERSRKRARGLSVTSLSCKTYTGTLGGFYISEMQCGRLRGWRWPGWGNGGAAADPEREEMEEKQHAAAAATAAVEKDRGGTHAAEIRVP